MSLGRTLVLNAAFQPVEVCFCEEAIWDLMKGTAEQVEGTGTFCHSQNLDVEIPSVIRQLRYHKPKKSGSPKSLPLTPRNVCARDRWICGYQIEGLCTGRATTRDHVHPTSKGGPDTWENMVASCKRCNHRKGSKLLRFCPCDACGGAENVDGLDWELKIMPWRPVGPLARVLVQSNRPEWMKYFQ